MDVFRLLSEGARPTIEYYILTILSCIIATTGLIQGSTATVIGAMIVAPLMTPILAFSLGVIWGDLGLMKTSLSSILKGTLIAIGISAVIAYLVPMATYSPEIIARTKPTLFDIIVAIASGIVGAYGNANRRISNTLVGIAIAVALMPPLCTIGIGLGSLNYTITTGAAILFIINLVSISLAGAFVFWLMKIHPVLADEDMVKKRALYQIVLSITVLVLIAVPVGIYMIEGYQLERAQQVVKEDLPEMLPGISIYQVETKKTTGGYLMLLTLRGEHMPSEEMVKDMTDRVTKEYPVIEKMMVDFIQSRSYR